jgi:uncharacterized protein (TIGR02594 family)
MSMELIKTALKYYGVKEFPGTDKNSPTIVGWLRSMLPWANNDEIAWCSAFVNGIAKEAKFEHFPSTHNNALAREWLKKGTAVTTPQLGDVVVLWRGSKDAVTGHVGFYIRENTDNVFLLGGNQSDSVNITAFPKSRVLGYRRLKKL